MRRRARPAAPFAVARAEPGPWGRAAKACLERLGPGVEQATFGLLYATPDLAPDLGSILAFLRETTRIPDWAGAVVPGLGEADGVAVLAGALPAGLARPFAGPWQPQPEVPPPGLALVHAAPHLSDLDAALAALGRAVPVQAGLVAARDDLPVLLADKMTPAGLGGVMFDVRLGAICEVAPGCVPIGPPHHVDEARDGVVMRLDGRLALDVLREEAGEILTRDLRRIAGFLHVGLGETAEGDWTAAMLRAIDPVHGWLGVEAHPGPGAVLRFVRRDPPAARALLDAMLGRVADRLGGRRVRAAILYADIGRDLLLFGHPGAEAERVRRALGPEVPLICVQGNGTVAGGRRQTLAAALVVLPEGDAPP